MEAPRKKRRGAAKIATGKGWRKEGRRRRIKERGKTTAAVSEKKKTGYAAAIERGKAFFLIEKKKRRPGVDEPNRKEIVPREWKREKKERGFEGEEGKGRTSRPVEKKDGSTRL